MNHPRTRLSRRVLLWHTARLAAGVGLLSACAPSAPAAPTSSAAPTAAAVPQARSTQPSGAAPAAASTAVPQQTKPGGSLTVGTVGDFASFDPFNLSSVNYPMIQSLYNQLVRFDHQMTVGPGLAESWSVSDDGKTLTLKLRKGVKFQSGRDMTADDVVKNFDKAHSKDDGWHLYPSTQPIDSVQAPDPATVVIHFSQVTPQMFDVMGSMSIIAPEAFPDLKKKGVGTGPFKFVEWIPGDHATMDRFTDYWDKPKPYVDRVIYKVFSDADALVAAFQGGSIDVVNGVPLKDATNLKTQFNITPGQEGTEYYALYVNPRVEPFNKKEVRQAMQWALDRSSIAANVLFGFAEPTLVPYPKFSPAYNPKFEGMYTFNLDRAKELLAAAGYASGFKASIIGPTSFPELLSMAQVLQADLAKIGGQLDIQPMDSAQWYPKLNSGDYDMTFSFSGNAQKYPTQALVGSVFRLENNTLWKDAPPPLYAEAVKAASSTIDKAAQRAAFDQIQQVLLDESWAIPVAWRPTLLGVQKSVSGLDWTVENELILDGVSLQR